MGASSQPERIPPSGLGRVKLGERLLDRRARLSARAHSAAGYAETHQRFARHAGTMSPLLCRREPRLYVVRKQEREEEREALRTLGDKNRELGRAQEGRSLSCPLALLRVGASLPKERFADEPDLTQVRPET